MSFFRLKALINFDTFSWSSNSVALCPNCHRDFNSPADPTFSFWPEDIYFFIRFELRDRVRRRHLPQLPRNEENKRRISTASQYKVFMHQKKNTEQEGEGWGTYNRVHLVDSCARRVTNESPIKEWGGAPFAALRRTIRIIGYPRSGRIPKDMLEKLQILRDFYYGEEDREAQVAVKKEYGLDPFAEPDDDSDEDEEDIEEKSAPRRKEDIFRVTFHTWLA